MTNDGLDPRYPDYRDYAALKERVTKVEASLMHLPGDVAEMRRKQDSLEAKLDAVLAALRDLQKSPSPDQGALALHHLADAFSKAKTSQQPAMLLVTAAVGCMAIGGWLTKFLGLGA